MMKSTITFIDTDVTLQTHAHTHMHSSPHNYFICEIGRSFIGTSDELKPNHKVIHSILNFFFIRFPIQMHYASKKVKSFVA